MSGIKVQVVKSFDDPAVAPEVWSKLLGEGDTDIGSLTWHAQRLWWQAHQRPDALLLVVAQRDGHTRAIAPLFAEDGMVMNLCPTTCLDFVGDIGDADVLDSILCTVQQQVPGFIGFRFYFLPDSSRTAQRLQQAAERLHFDCFLEDDEPSPIIDIRGKPDAALACTQKKNILRAESHLRRDGVLEVHHFRRSDEILAQLDEFFEQHISRWAGTSTPSSFCIQKQRESFRERTLEHARAGWLRFSRLDWNGRPIAFHRGTCYRGRYMYGKPSFALELAAYSPGSILLRHLILAAIEEGAHTFDFGLGDEPYKRRYATDVLHVQTWGLYLRTTGQ